MVTSRLPSLLRLTLQNSFLMPGTANSIVYSLPFSFTLMAGAVAFILGIQSLLKNSSNIVGNQLFELITGNIITSYFKLLFLYVLSASCSLSGAFRFHPYK